MRLSRPGSPPLVPHRRSLNDLAPLAATHARLKWVERALSRWDAYDARQGPNPQGLTRAQLENLRDMLVQALAEKQAAARLDVWQRRN